jgi:hypothetical protein
VVFEERQRHEQRVYGKKRDVKGESCMIPLADIWKMEAVITFTHSLLFEEYDAELSFAHGMADSIKNGGIMKKKRG